MKADGAEVGECGRWPGRQHMVFYLKDFTVVPKRRRGKKRRSRKTMVVRLHTVI